MYELADLLRVDEIGNMMAYPVVGKDEEVIAVIALISPYSKHVWTASDQEYLQNALPPITTLLERAIKPQTNEHALKTLEENLSQANSEKTQLEEEKLSLETQVADLTEKLQAGPPLPPEINELVVQNQSLESAMALTTEENLELQQKLNQLEETNKALEDEKISALSDKQAIAKEHARLFEEHRVLATEHALVL